ncbi:DUF4349 domain-containing protein [Kribbella capetownensis]|uniref:DUF4349 domain-containing protein n=1 Tax=Kribbella capetownensis TaxID=1572659 RepID=A0A4R0JLA2_9ACTN|nr:DUF4349 domain-containing protein [Kribbella capetownensis]TCC46604.1 DUF4349 domain-containing protein [Kribbella capetownensis]
MRRIRGAVVAVAALGIVLLAGCGGSSNENSAGGVSGPAQRQDGGSGASAGDSGKVAEGASGSGAPKASGQPQEQPSVTRAIIKTGSLTVEADDVNGQRQKAITVVTSLRGQVASEDTGSNADGKITQANLVLKVPTASYETAIQRLSDLGKRVQIHQESADVTEQVVDVESRINSQRASLERMRTLLAKANTIGEIVSVETELTRREADLESLLAKQKNLSLQTELATLTLTLTEKGKPPVAEDPDRGFLAGLKGGWSAFVATFAALATALGAVLPFLVLIALIGVPLWRNRHRLRRQPALPQTPDGGQ